MKLPGISCPECHIAFTRVIDSRAKGHQIRRRRECYNGHRFTTYERVVGPITPRQPPFHWLAHNRIPT
jgi:hypothetical protein